MKGIVKHEIRDKNDWHIFKEITKEGTIDELFEYMEELAKEEILSDIEGSDYKIERRLFDEYCEYYIIIPDETVKKKEFKKLFNTFYHEVDLKQNHFHNLPLKMWNHREDAFQFNHRDQHENGCILEATITDLNPIGRCFRVFYFLNP